MCCLSLSRISCRKMMLNNQSSSHSRVFYVMLYVTFYEGTFFLTQPSQWCVLKSTANVSLLPLVLKRFDLFFLSFIQAMESKLLVGGKNIVDHTNEQQRMLEQKRQEIAEQVCQTFLKWTLLLVWTVDKVTAWRSHNNKMVITGCRIIILNVWV